MKLAGRKILIEATWKNNGYDFALSCHSHVLATIYHRANTQVFTADLSGVPLSTFSTLAEAVAWVEQQLGVKTWAIYGLGLFVG